MAIGFIQFHEFSFAIHATNTAINDQQPGGKWHGMNVDDIRNNRKQQINKTTMKFLLTTALAIFLFNVCATAQHANIGIKAGLNFSNIKTDNDIEYDNAIGYHVGLLAHIHLANKFAMQPELVYSTQGADYELSGQDGEINLDYLNVPIMFQYMFDNGFRLQAGPQIGFLLNAKQKYNGGSDDLKDDSNRIDFGIGAGVSYVHPPTGWGFDARYNMGLNNINKDDGADVMNRNIQVGIFYLFNHKS